MARKRIAQTVIMVRYRVIESQVVIDGDHVKERHGTRVRQRLLAILTKLLGAVLRLLEFVTIIFAFVHQIFGIHIRIDSPR